MRNQLATNTRGLAGWRGGFPWTIPRSNANWTKGPSDALARIARYMWRMLREPPDFFTTVPVEDNHGRLSAAGVPIRCDVGHLPEKLYVNIDRALNAKAAASGANMPVALDPDVCLIRCRRCNAPFIGLPRAKLCSDPCRADAARASVRKANAKRGERRAAASNDRTSVCRHCGERLPARRSSRGSARSGAGWRSTGARLRHSPPRWSTRWRRQKPHGRHGALTTQRRSTASSPMCK
jgi:hypothetical protein